VKKSGVTKPTKQRKRRYNAPQHLKRKHLSAPLSPAIRVEHGVRSMPIVKDDTVTITKGDRRLSEGKVLRVDTKESRVYIEGVTRNRLDGSTVQIPIRPANVMITRLNLDDDWRKKVLERRGFGNRER